MPDIAQTIEALLPGLRVIAAPGTRHAKAPPAPLLKRLSGTSGRGFPRHYFPNTPQRRMHALKGWRFLVACAGRRGGKTKSGGATFVDRVLEDLESKLWGRGKWAGDPHPPWQPQPGKDPEPFLRYFVLAPTHALNDEPKIALRKYFGHVDDPEPGLIVDQAERPCVWWLRGGIRVDFLSGDDPDLNVSHGYDGGWMEEAARLKPAVWRDNMRPSMSDKLGWVLFTTTPKGRNWLWEDLWAKGDAKAAAQVAKIKGCPVSEVRDSQFVCISWTTADNDAIPHLKAEMETARRQMSDANWRRNYKADFEAYEGQCFDLKDDNFAGWRRGARLKRIYAGYDPGMNHPASFSIVVQSASNDAWHEAATESGSDVLPYGDDAWKDRDRGNRTTWANRLYQALRGIMGDLWRAVPVHLPADRPDIEREWQRYGFKVEAAYQEHEDAVTWVNTALINKRLVIGSEVLWNCLTGIRYPGPGEHSTKLWIDKNDDEWDSLRYALSALIRDGEAPTSVPLSAMGWNRA